MNEYKFRTKSLGVDLYQVQDQFIWEDLVKVPSWK